MTEVEWNTSTDLTRMLIFLRGEVEPPTQEPDTRPRIITAHGDLVAGPGTRVEPDRLARFARECCRKWWDLPLDQPSQELITGYERFLDGLGTWEEHTSACSRAWESQGQRSLVSGSEAFSWSPTPFGMSHLTQHLAWVTSCHTHRNRIRELERTATEDDRFAWGFFGYDFPEFIQGAVLDIDGGLTRTL